MRYPLINLVKKIYVGIPGVTKEATYGKEHYL